MTVQDDTRKVRQASIGWMIQRITRRLDDAMNAKLAELDMNLATFAVMMTVLEDGPLTQAEIGARFGTKAYAISRSLDALERSGYVARGPHAASRRAHSIRATPAGEAIAPRLFQIVQQVNADLTASLTGDERAQFADLLSKVMGGPPG